jgi:polyhydroxyalkanoate synthase
VKAGYDVYLLDWGKPGKEDKDLTFADYALEYIPRAVRKMKTVSGSEEFSLLGWCIGSIITTLYASLRPDDGLRNLLLLTAPLDFTAKESLTFAKWTDERYFDLDRILETFGNMPGEMIDYGARALKPVENYVSSYVKLFDNADDPQAVEAWHAMNTWMTDLVPIAGGAFRQLIDDLYRNNRLIKGEFVLRGERVDLARIKANLLNVIATADHITPACQSESVMSKVSSTDKELIRINGGHIGIMAGGQAKKTWPLIDDWLAARSQ